MLNSRQVKKLLHGAILYQDGKVIGRISICRRSSSSLDTDCVYFCQNVEDGRTIASEKLGFTKFKILDPLYDFTTSFNSFGAKLESNNQELIDLLNTESSWVFTSHESLKQTRITSILLQHQATLYDFV